MHTFTSSTCVPSANGDYSLLHSEEQASLEAALSFLAECDGANGDASTWRLHHDDAMSMDVDLDEVHDDEVEDDPELHALLASAPHIPVLESITTNGSSSQTGRSSSASNSVYGFTNSTDTDGGNPEYPPHHNPGMMMAIMSAGFPTIDFNPQSLLMAPNSNNSSPVAALQGETQQGTSSPTTATSGGNSASGRGASPSSTALVKKKSTKKKPAGYNSNRARDERKEELIYLRKTVLEMEERLSKLKKNTGDAGGASSSAPPFSPNSSSSSTASSSGSSEGETVAMTTAQAQARSAAQLSNSVWEDIATRQYKERRRAELENIRLKLILEGQIKMAKSLEKILKKRTSLRVRVHACFTSA